MTTIVKRLPVLALVGIILASILSGGSLAIRPLSAATAVATAGSSPVPAGGGTPAAQPGQAALPATKPVIHASLNSTEIAGMAGSFCWPQTDASLPQCDFQPDTQPTTSINVTEGDSIVFTVDPPSPAPIAVRATLLDDKNADGDTIVTDLTAIGNIYTVENLTGGNHRLEVDGIYAGEVQGNRPFVGYVYLLSVAGSNVTVGTAAPTIAATAEVTAIAQVSETPQPSPSLSAPTATEFPTIIAPTSIPPTVESTAVVVTVEVPTAGMPSATPIPLITSTPLPPTEIPQPTLEPTATVVEPTAETATEPPTAAPTELSPVTAGMVPPLLITVGGRIYEPIAVNSCTLGASGESVCVNRPADTSAPRIVASPADAAQITFQGARPTSVIATIYTSDGTKALDKQTLRPDNLILYTFPSAAGNYVLAVEISFPQGKATYYFRLGINAG